MSQTIIGIGVDMEQVSRFAPYVAQKNDVFLRRLFSPQELAYCNGQSHPEKHYAARFCAKEALVKAASHKAPVLITDFYIGHTDKGAPVVKYWKRPAMMEEIFLDAMFMISLSHTQELAVAYATLIGLEV